MATIKSYTDISQSKKLAKILPLESADMYYEKGIGNNYRIDFGNYADISISKNLLHFDAIPCWSLAALLNVLPEVSLNSFKDGNWNAMVKQNGKMIYGDTGDPIDACYELILKLHERNLL